MNYFKIIYSFGGYDIKETIGAAHGQKQQLKGVLKKDMLPLIFKQICTYASLRVLNMGLL